MHRYSLEKYSGPSSRYTCPNCGNKGEFSRYKDNVTGEYLTEDVGRCNRESTCGYHFTPKQYFERNPTTITKQTAQPIPTYKATVDPKLYVPNELFFGSLNGGHQNNFVEYLMANFDEPSVKLALEQYKIGTSNHWGGATVFWQIDLSGHIRAGKIMQFCPKTGKRIKNPDHITWVHSVCDIPNYQLTQCLYGEHLIEDKIVAVVESEKTAIIASIMIPEYTWLATGGLSNLTPAKCKALQGRSVLLYPDAGCYDTWQKKAEALSHIGEFKVSSLLEDKLRNAGIEEGCDLADVLITKKSVDPAIQRMIEKNPCMKMLIDSFDLVV